jgi:hypothetical protein
MATQTTTPSGERVVSVFNNGEWVTKTITANSLGELRVALEIPAEATVNIQDSLYTDNSSTMPVNEVNDDGTKRPLCIAWQANNKTGGTK